MNGLKGKKGVAGDIGVNGEPGIAGLDGLSVRNKQRNLQCDPRIFLMETSVFLG